MKVLDHVVDACDSARHVAQQIILVAAVDTDVGVCVPGQHRVNAAVTLLKIVEVTVHRIPACSRVVEVAVLDHHLGLNEGCLCPLEFRTIVFPAVKASADQAFMPIVLDVGKPVLEVRLRCGHLALPGAAVVLGFGRVGRPRNLLALRRKLRILA